MLHKLDPRISLLWWIAISTLALRFKTPFGQAVLVAITVATWLLSGKRKELLRFSRSVLFLLLFITLVRPIRATIGTQRIYVLLASSALVIVMGSSRFTSAVRNLRSNRLPFLDVPIELLANLLGQGLMTVPLVALELDSLQQSQRARGLEPSPRNVFLRAKRGVALTMPLFRRMLDRNRYIQLSSDLLGYDPFGTRTIFDRLDFSKRDWVATFAILVFFILAFILKV